MNDAKQNLATVVYETRTEYRVYQKRLAKILNIVTHHTQH